MIGETMGSVHIIKKKKKNAIYIFCFNLRMFEFLFYFTIILFFIYFDFFKIIIITEIKFFAGHATWWKKTYFEYLEKNQCYFYLNFHLISSSSKRGCRRFPEDSRNFFLWVKKKKKTPDILGLENSYIWNCVCLFKFLFTVSRV